jgi:hypothetical protein
MTTFYLIRTERLHEERVASDIRAMGYEAWAPFEVHGYRVTRKSSVHRHREHPVIPGALFAAVPETFHGDLQRIRYFDRIQRDVALAPVQIPAIHIRRFADTLADWNERELRRISAGNRGRPAKRAWVKLEPGNVASLMAALFGGDASP